MSGGRVEGFDEAMKAFDEEKGKITKALKSGLWEIALQVQRVAQHELKKSVITGNLRASAYARVEDRSERLDSSAMIDGRNGPMPSDSHGEIWSEVGFTANYALYAHENMEGRAPKFLEGPVNRNKSEFPKIIKNRLEKR